MSATRYGCGVPLGPPSIFSLFGPVHSGGADLVDERPVRRELQDVRVVAERRRPRIGRQPLLLAGPAVLAVAGHVHEIVVIHEDAVLARRPEAAVRLAAVLVEESRIGGSAPGREQVAFAVELEHGRRRDTAARAAFGVRSWMAERADRHTLVVRRRPRHRAGRARVERPRPVIDPDVVVRVHGNTADLADPPIVRQRLRPACIHHEARRRCARRSPRRPARLSELVDRTGVAERGCSRAFGGRERFLRRARASGAAERSERDGGGDETNG